MQISVQGGGVDTVSDLYPQVLGFVSRWYVNLICLFQIQHGLHDVIERIHKSLSGYVSTLRVMQVPVILLCLFQIIIQQNRNDSKYFSSRNNNVETKVELSWSCVPFCIFLLFFSLQFIEPQRGTLCLHTVSIIILS